MPRMWTVAVETQPPTFSFAVFLSLLAIVLAGGTVFHFLTKRWTHDRLHTAICDWAEDRGFSLRRSPRALLPAALESLKSLDARADVSMIHGHHTLLKLVTLAPNTQAESIWHLLIRGTHHAWWPAGLRPINHKTSLIDLFAMTDFPTLLPPERFVVYGSESRAARAIAKSSARGLLPPDIGLIVHGPFVTLDFSARPFDPIEFDRMIAVMEQVVPQLPAIGKHE